MQSRDNVCKYIGVMSVQNQQALEFIVDVFVATVETQLSISASVMKEKKI